MALLWNSGVIAAFLGQARQEGGELFTTRPVAHKPHNIHLELEEWTWIAFGSDVDGVYSTKMVNWSMKTEPLSGKRLRL